jgi:hypothetical protein
LFVVVTGEEKGLLGSRYFAAHPTVDSKSMVADLNTDMFLPLYPLHVVTVYGLHESDLGDTVRKVAQSLDVEVQDDPAPQRNVFIRSDQYSFIRAGVPSLMMDVGYKKGSKEEERREGVAEEPLSRAFGRSEPARGSAGRRSIQPLDPHAGRNGGQRIHRVLSGSLTVSFAASRSRSLAQAARVHNPRPQPFAPPADLRENEGLACTIAISSREAGLP